MIYAFLTGKTIIHKKAYDKLIIEEYNGRGKNS